jgi:hypothetical protein
MALRNFSSTAQRTTTTGSLTNVATSVTVAATTGFPATPFIGILEPDTSSEEVVLVTNVASLTLTITRGYDSTPNVAHNNGVIFQHGFSAIDFREANAAHMAVTGLAPLYVVAPEEKWNIVGSNITGTIACDYVTAQNWYYTTASTAGACTINLRGSSGTTLASLLAVGDSATFTFLAATGATTPGYFGTVQVDGTVTGVTTKWQYGSAPTAGSTSSTDGYTFTVVKTAATPTYTVFASVAKFG